jgi:hypothetical protein
MNIQMSKETSTHQGIKGDKRCKEIGRISAGKSIRKSGLEKDVNMKCNKASPPRKETVFS